MSGAGRTAVDVTVFGSRGGSTSGSASQFFASRSARNVAASGRQRFEDRVEALDSLFRAANHHAVSAFESPDAAARAHVDVVDAFDGADFGAAYVIDRKSTRLNS